MRTILFAAAAIAISPACAMAADVPLSPMGLPFKPGAPKAVAPDHPLYHRIALDPVADMPGVVGASATAGIMGAAKRSSFEKALRETLDKLNLLAPNETQAKVRLSPRWIGMDAPFKISFSSEATVRMGWRLTRIDNGQRIFDQEIATSAKSKGGSGSERATGVGRVALMTNIASAMRCIDLAAYGQAPQDCALTPDFTYKAPTYHFMFVPAR
ncbi:hypothetical protein [Sphingobium sp. HWE2-09]|uniref:hypothetical protein n=1 Tax=Sphingobium sp. HWE2-09 TaxID=3108390 RepID=UPI002DCC58AB|nr:hypothetical protein [Sphingobium sp. HWE2-09]